MNPDYIYHGQWPSLGFNFTYVSCPRVSNDAVLKHDCDPPAAQLLSRALCCGLLLQPGLQGQERYNLHWKYQGALKDIVVDLRASGQIRGLISPSSLSDLAEDREELYGNNGQLSRVTSRNGRILNSGSSPCELLNVSQDLAYALSVSDQVESELNVMVAFNPDPEQPVRICRGLLLQAAPECDLLQFMQIRERLHHEDLRRLLATELERDGLCEDLLRALVPEEHREDDFHLEAGPSPRWFCTCSRDKFEQSLRMLPQSDREEILRTGEESVVRCDFCNRRFRFSAEEAREIWERD